MSDYFRGMGKARTGSVLYSLIEAGQLTRNALLTPLHDRGLDPGDDAILLMLHRSRPTPEADLNAALGMNPSWLAERLARLAARGMIDRQSEDLTLTLSERGRRICDGLMAHRSVLEDALFRGLDRKQRKALRKALDGYAEKLAR